MKATNVLNSTTLKKLFTISTLIALTTLGTNAYAGATCKYDWLGNWVCDYSGSGYQTTTKRDWLGNDVTRDNRGRHVMTCKTDWLGNYVCN